MRRLALLLSLLASFSLSVFAQPAWHPIAATRADNGSLFLLTSEGDVVAVNLTATSGSVVGHFAFHALGNAVDMTLGSVNSRPALFIAFNTEISAVPSGRVVALTTEGKTITFWSSPAGTIGGLTFDPSSQTLYFTSGIKPEVFSLKAQPKAQPHFVGSIIGAQKLGPLTVSPDQQRLFITDAQGDIFYLDLEKTLQPQGLLGHTRVPQAVLVSPSAAIVYVADSGTGQIVALAARPKMAAVAPNLTPPGTFRAPSGLAWLDPSHLIVADQRRASVYVVDLSGKITATIRLTRTR